jgi:peroxisomal 3,2-trans-enoyl-CoA isomerase
MSNEQVITVSYQDRVAIVTLNRPDKLNALNADLYYLLGERLREIDSRKDIFITVVTGTGRFFSAYVIPCFHPNNFYIRQKMCQESETHLTFYPSHSGADVTSTRPGSGDLSSNVRRELVKGFVANNVDVTRSFYNHSKILVVALNGPAVGLSAALVAHADFIYAAPHTFILTPFSSLGLVAEGGASRAFVERLGIAKANEALIMSKRISCDELVAAGFVNKVITPESGKKEDSDGFLKKVLEEVEDRLGTHLNQTSLLGIKELIRRPERELLDRQNGIEAFAGLERFLAGYPQEEFRRLASGEKRHKL